MVRAEGGSLRFWGPGLLSTSPAFSMSSASHSAGSSGWLAQKTGAGPTFQWAGKVDAICRSRSNRAKRPRAGCIFRSTHTLSFSASHDFTPSTSNTWFPVFLPGWSEPRCPFWLCGPIYLSPCYVGCLSLACLLCGGLLL